MPAWLPVVVAALVALGLFSLAWFELSRASAGALPDIPLAVTRDQATERSVTFLQDTLGADLAGYSVTTVWTYDLDPLVYLEQELGVEQTSAVANDVELWRFTTRMVRPGTDETFLVYVGPDGRVVGYRRSISDDASGARLDSDQALALADTARRQLVPMDGVWQLVDGASTDQASRRDWTFTWVRTDYQLPPTHRSDDEPAHVQLSVSVHGDRADAISRSLAPPLSWTRQHEQHNQTKLVANAGAWLVGFYAFVVAALGVVLLRRHGGQLQWRMVAWIALFVGLTRALDVANSLSSLVALDYSPDVSWAAFVASEVGRVAWVDMWPVALFGVAGEALYRQYRPHLPSLRASLTWRGLMTRSGVAALGVGLLAACLLGPYQDLFYALTSGFGFWQPANSYYEFLFDPRLPWLEPGFDGLDAALREEFVYRLFAIPLLSLALTRWTGRARLAQWLAIVVSAFAWGFTHTGQVHEPFYARGIEVGLMGILLGWLLVRFGILAPLTAHFVFDALTDAQGLAHSGPLSVGLLAHAVAAIPLLIVLACLVQARLRGGFVPDAGLQNDDLTRGLAARPTNGQAVWLRFPAIWHAHTAAWGDDLPVPKR